MRAPFVRRARSHLSLKLRDNTSRRSHRITAHHSPRARMTSRSRGASDSWTSSSRPLGLIGLAPLFIFVSTAIIVDSGWPPLYTQERVGLLGRRFRMWKFRTMRRGAHELRSTLLSRNEAPFPVFKLHDDPRVTRVGPCASAVEPRRIAAALECRTWRDEPRRSAPAAARGGRRVRRARVPASRGAAGADVHVADRATAPRRHQLRRVGRAWISRTSRVGGSRTTCA